LNTPSPPPPRILVAGFGYVGAPLARLLAGRGFSVTALSRSGGKSPPDGITVEACDISDQLAVGELAARVGPVGSIIHCASSSGGAGREDAYRAVYLEGCRNLLDAFSPARFVFTGSTSVYAQIDGSLIDETSPAEPPGATGKILREAENLVLGAGHLVARLAGIYGPGRSFLLKRYLEGAAAIDGESEADAGRWINQIHRDDAATALALLATSGIDGPAICNVCDDTPFLQRPFYERLSATLGLPVPPTRPPDTGRKRGWTHKQVSNARLRALGWTPRYPSYFDAVENDNALLSSIRNQISS
jgi:nucleoside-diphosphate-sugar epimerase